VDGKNTEGHCAWRMQDLERASHFDGNTLDSVFA
jgi:hypothetical protein